MYLLVLSCFTFILVPVIALEPLDRHLTSGTKFKDDTIVALYDETKQLSGACVRLKQSWALCHKAAISQNVKNNGKSWIVPGGLSDLRYLNIDMPPTSKVLKVIPLNCGHGDMVLIKTSMMKVGKNAILPIKTIPAGLPIWPYFYWNGKLETNRPDIELRTLDDFSCPSFFNNFKPAKQFCAQWSMMQNTLDESYTGTILVYQPVDQGETTIVGFAIPRPNKHLMYELVSDVYPCTNAIKQRVQNFVQ